MLVCSFLSFQGFPAVNLENASNPTEAFFSFFDMKDHVVAIVICVRRWSLWDTNQWLGAVWFGGKGESLFAVSGLEKEGS